VICSVATILDELTDTKNNLPEFHFHRQPNYETAASWSFNHVISWHPNNSAEHWTSRTKCIFSRLAKALQQFLCRKPRCWAILGKNRRCRLICSIAVLLSINKATQYAFLLDFTAEQSHLRYVWLRLVRKCFNMFKWYTSSSGVKPSFLKWDFGFSSALESSAYLRLTPSVKPSIIYTEIF